MAPVWGRNSQSAVAAAISVTRQISSGIGVGCVSLKCKSRVNPQRKATYKVRTDRQTDRQIDRQVGTQAGTPCGIITTKIGSPAHKPSPLAAVAVELRVLDLRLSELPVQLLFSLSTAGERGDSGAAAIMPACCIAFWIGVKGDKGGCGAPQGASTAAEAKMWRSRWEL